MWYERTLAKDTETPEKSEAIERIKIVDGVVVEAQLHYKSGKVSIVYPNEKWTLGDPTTFDRPFKIVKQ